MPRLRDNIVGKAKADAILLRMLNTGSPFNVPAGHGYSNIDAAIEKYQKQNYEENARKYQALKENRIPAEHPLAPEVAYPAQAADVVRSAE